MSARNDLVYLEEVIERRNERIAELEQQLAELRERNIEYQRLYNEMAEELSFWYSG